MSSKESDIREISGILKGCLRQVPNFPKKGILFEDFLPIFANLDSFRLLVKAFKLYLEGQKVDYVVGLESRGFLFGPTLALELNAGFIPVRKPGKLPGKVLSVDFEKEYGKDSFEIQADVIPRGAKVVIVDDILATGGSAWAAEQLVNKLEGEVIQFLFVMELDFLEGRKKLSKPVFTLLSGQQEALKN